MLDFLEYDEQYTHKEVDKMEYCKRKIESSNTPPLEKFAYWKTKRIIEKQEYDKEGMQDLKKKRGYKYEEV